MKKKLQKGGNMEIYDTAIKHFGTTHQILKTVEELSELSTALMQSQTKKDDNTKDILEEVADVYIMLEQLKKIFNFSEVQIIEKKREKQNKLESYLPKV